MAVRGFTATSGSRDIASVGNGSQRWGGDTTEFVIGRSGKLYLAAVLDLYSRFLVRLGRQRDQ